MKKITILPLLLLLVGLFSYGFMLKPMDNQTEEIKWVSMEEAEKLAKEDGKKILIDFYTDWCGWCKRMDRDTYEKPKIVKYVNENFHAVKFDAEQREDVTIDNHTFKYVSSGRRGYNELASSMLEGKMSFPSTVFLNPDLTKLVQLAGYRAENDMFVILNYLNDEVWKKEISFEEYNKDFYKKDKPAETN